MPEQTNRGKKIRCSKCGAQYYDLGRKKAPCPSCNRASLIKAGTLAEISLRLIKGGYNDPRQGWTDGWVTQNSAGAAYLNCEFEITAGPFAGKKFRGLIGLHTPKGAWWGEKGRQTIREILNSAHNLSNEDYSPDAIETRLLSSLGQLNSLAFAAEIGLGKGPNGLEKNEISAVITPDDERYSTVERAKALSEPAPHRPSKAEDTSSKRPIWMSKV